MKTFLTICMFLIAAVSFAQVDADPDRDGMQYSHKGETIDEATTLEEVVYDRNAIPVNCPAKKYRQFKKQQERAKRKYYGTRWIDRTGDSMASLGRGIGRVAVYVATGLVVTVIVGAILNTAQNSQ
jgi:hypothetical protein